jgi:hypothetical protein
MDLTIKNYKSSLPPELIKKAQRCLVRECDEIKPKHFVSYVDESDNSYDVSLTFDKALIIAHQCDCTEPIPFCHHKVALLAFIETGRSSTPKIAKNKKVDPILEALEQANPEKIKEWILKVIQKNKDLSVAFLHEFTAETTEYTPKEILALTDNAVKSVLNKRMKANAAEVKKIVELWSDVHQKVLTSYFTEPTDERKYQLFRTIVDNCIFYGERIYTTSKRIDGYVKRTTEDAGNAIATIRDQEAWTKSLQFIVNDIFLEDFGLRKWSLGFILDIFNAGSIDRRGDIVNILAKFYEDKTLVSRHDRSDLMQFLFQLVTENQSFSKYKHLFVPEKHAFSYNINLIDHLLAEGDLSSAEQYCLKQIAENTLGKFDYEYLVRLSEIYKITGDEQKLVNVVKHMLIHEPDFLDYQFVLLHHPDEADFKKWRYRVLANARKLAVYDRNAANFMLSVLHYENDFKALNEYIDRQIGYQEIAQYANVLLTTLPEDFITKLITKIDCPEDTELYIEDPAQLTPLLETIYKLVSEYYEEKHLRIIVSRRFKAYKQWSNIFIKYLAEKFGFTN